MPRRSSPPNRSRIERARLDEPTPRPLPSPRQSTPRSTHDIELERIVSLKEAVRLSGMSEDTLKRRHSDKIMRLSPGRLGMRIRDALMMGGE